MLSLRPCFHEPEGEQSMSDLTPRERYASDVKLSYRSRPDSRRPAYKPTVGVLVVSWLLTLALLVLSGYAVATSTVNRGTALLSLAFMILLSVYLTYFTYRFIKEGAKTYVFELAEDEIRLKSFETGQPGHILIARLPYRDISFVEYFTPRDHAALVFHSRSGPSLDVPVGLMMDNVSPVLELLNQKHISVKRV